jgi:hypothetical protein
LIYAQYLPMINTNCRNQELMQSLRLFSARVLSGKVTRQVITPTACLLMSLGLMCGCQRNPVSGPPPSSPLFAPAHRQEAATAANRDFLRQENYHPWILTSVDSQNPLPLYLGQGKTGLLINSQGLPILKLEAGHYERGRLQSLPISEQDYRAQETKEPTAYKQELNLWTGEVKTIIPGKILTHPKRGDNHPERGKNHPEMGESFPERNPAQPDWPRLWQASDIRIVGDAQAQQVLHANLFYLLSSTYPGSTHSLPPMGLSSTLYDGRIFWDAEMWMLPALLPQHPEYARTVVEYRFQRLEQARRNARQHGFRGAEYPWESADTGEELAPAEFVHGRHVTADVGFAAWQYYLWTGDRDYLLRQGWPLLRETADYWVSRVKRGPEGFYHILGVLSPDEDAFIVNDDTFTNAVVQVNLMAAERAARILGKPADPRWRQIAARLFFAKDKTRGILAPNSAPLTDSFKAKQASVLMLLHPLGRETDADMAKRMLNFYVGRTLQHGPAMTKSIESVVAARLGRAQQALDLFYESYRPFMQAPWNAFSEKRASTRGYFLTGMAGCVQNILYGFAGLQAVSPWQKGTGTRLLSDSEGALYADPHLPPGWKELTIQGIRFRGKSLNLTILPGNKMRIHWIK